ncbi:hypothetical protein [Sphingopyxis sp. JAI108]|uniref:hypothetical protein n=1 Tax=Sphingopyxis sp. JAI108 TaxID=2723060 RepID=UPI0015C963E6|nr:hypothetical protein [Sphingopyxis sp. JAI108]NYF33332.1 hypothetical protein [Sphingopyxis sp. JAI108]
MHRHFSRYLIILAATVSMTVTSSAHGDTPHDPDAYNCLEELRSTEFGTLQAYVYANKRSDYLSFEGEWRTDFKSVPRIRVFWNGRAFSLDRDLKRGRFHITYSGIVSANKVRIHLGGCPRNRDACKGGADYTSAFEQNSGYLRASLNWDDAVSIGRGQGYLYIQIQDEVGAVLREDKLPVATLLAVEREMGRLMDAVSEKQARLKDRCREREPLNTPPH